MLYLTFKGTQATFAFKDIQATFAFQDTLPSLAFKDTQASLAFKGIKYRSHGCKAVEGFVGRSDGIQATLAWLYRYANPLIPREIHSYLTFFLPKKFDVSSFIKRLNNLRSSQPIDTTTL